MQQKLTISSEHDTLRFTGSLDIYSVEAAKTALLEHLASRPALAADPYLTTRGTHMPAKLRVVS